MDAVVAGELLPGFSRRVVWIFEGPETSAYLMLVLITAYLPIDEGRRCLTTSRAHILQAICCGYTYNIPCT